MKYHSDLQKWLILSDEPIVNNDISPNPPEELSIYEHALEWINKAQAVYRDHLVLARKPMSSIDVLWKQNANGSSY